VLTYESTLNSCTKFEECGIFNILERRASTHPLLKQDAVGNGRRGGAATLWTGYASSLIRACSHYCHPQNRKYALHIALLSQDRGTVTSTRAENLVKYRRVIFICERTDRQTRWSQYFEGGEVFSVECQSATKLPPTTIDPGWTPHQPPSNVFFISLYWNYFFNFPVEAFPGPHSGAAAPCLKLRPHQQILKRSLS